MNNNPTHSPSDRIRNAAKDSLRAMGMTHPLHCYPASMSPTLAAQVFIADLVAERCFFEIARRRVANDPLIRPEAKGDKIQRYAFEFSKKYGRRIHEALVDQTLFSRLKLLLEDGIRLSSN